MKQITTKELLDKLGREEVRKALFSDKTVEQGKKSLTQASWRGNFPASWFNEIDALCSKHGIECPRNLFNWVGEHVA